MNHHYYSIALYDCSSTCDFPHGTRSNNIDSNFCTGKSFFLFLAYNSRDTNKLQGCRNSGQMRALPSDLSLVLQQY